MESCSECGSSWNGAVTHWYGCSYYFLESYAPPTPKKNEQMYQQLTLMYETPTTTMATTFIQMRFECLT